MLRAVGGHEERLGRGCDRLATVQQQLAHDRAGAGRAGLEGLAHRETSLPQAGGEMRRLRGLPASVPAFEHHEPTGHQVLAEPGSGADWSPAARRRARRTDRRATMPAA